MIVEALTVGAILYGLVVQPAAKYLLINHALTPRDATRVVVLQDGRHVKISAAVVENNEGEEAIKFEIWDDGQGGRLLTAAELALLNEGRALKKERELGIPLLEADRASIMGMIEALRRELLTSRARAVK